jgi:hypothetical protein
VPARGDLVQELGDAALTLPTDAQGICCCEGGDLRPPRRAASARAARPPARQRRSPGG